MYSNGGEAPTTYNARNREKVKQVALKFDWTWGYSGYAGGIDVFHPTIPYLLPKDRDEHTWTAKIAVHLTQLGWGWEGVWGRGSVSTLTLESP